MLSTKTAPSTIWTTRVTNPTTRLVRATQWKYRRLAGRRLAAAYTAATAGVKNEAPDRLPAKRWPSPGPEGGLEEAAVPRAARGGRGELGGGPQVERKGG